MARSKRLECVECGGYNLQIYVDSHRIQQVIDNFISNAVKFSPEGSIVEISVQSLGDMVKIGVREYGGGAIFWIEVPAAESAVSSGIIAN